MKKLHFETADGEQTSIQHGDIITLLSCGTEIIISRPKKEKQGYDSLFLTIGSEKDKTRLGKIKLYKEQYMYNHGIEFHNLIIIIATCCGLEFESIRPNTVTIYAHSADSAYKFIESKE
jgi:hypothetical protein